MGQLVAIIVILVLVISSFVPLALHDKNEIEKHDVKYNLNLSARTLMNNIEESKINYDTLQYGFSKNGISDVNIDKPKLLREFYDNLFKNYGSQENYEKVKNSILVKALVLNDRFYISGKNDIWSAPFFFTKDVGGNLVYVSAKDDLAYWYNGSNKQVGKITDVGINAAEKNDIIIKKVNQLVAQYTYDVVDRKNGLSIQIYNPDKQDGEYKSEMSKFNLLKGGITFFVVYGENSIFSSRGDDIKYKNYNVVGYTLQ